MTATLAARWQRLWTGLGLPAPAGLLPALLAAYSEPQRHYHTLQHLEECFAHFDGVKELAEHPLDIELALWFHDSVYDVHARDNEARSSDWADRALREAGLPNDACARIHALIMATCHDALPASPDARLLTDIDLAILGAEPERFAEYERQIRAEYAHVPQEIFTRERGRILARFLARSPLFHTTVMQTRLAAPARRNLQHALQ
ncbi:MAG TPA: N-methyl-D-aspartate receptor NMDAR2C subunit [Massilia sp.]|nr:N-methyl-D-aspartate receptor NMDAR2C subunit [Massilia sp.]